MTSEEQLNLWLKGEPVHNKERGECCPDFSCCQPHLLAPQHEREAFVRTHGSGDEATKLSMLYKFLGRAMSSHKVYVAGYEENYKEEKG